MIENKTNKSLKPNEIFLRHLSLTDILQAKELSKRQIECSCDTNQCGCVPVVASLYVFCSCSCPCIIPPSRCRAQCYDVCQNQCTAGRCLPVCWNECQNACAKWTAMVAENDHFLLHHISRPLENSYFNQISCSNLKLYAVLALFFLPLLNSTRKIYKWIYSIARLYVETLW